MNPYVYDGIDPKIAFWITAGLTLLLFIGVIYESSRSFEGWDKKSWLSVGIVGILWCGAFGVMFHSDLGNKDGIEKASKEATKFVEVNGLEITSGEINPEPGNVSNLTVKLAGTENETGCNVYAPDDASKPLETLCGEGERGMKPEDLVRWFEDDKPAEMDTYEVSDEDSKKIVESVTVEQVEEQ